MATNDCGEQRVSETITVTKPIVITTDLSTQIGKWSLGPNPSTGSTNLIFANALTEQVNYKVVDLVGRQILAGEMRIGTEKQSIQIDEQGIYLVILSRNDASSIKRLTIID